MAAMTTHAATPHETGTSAHEALVTRLVRCFGIVQGVGFRPTVARHAVGAGVCGTVCNKGPYVEIIAQGSPERVARFTDLVRRHPPRRAYVIKVDEWDVPAGTARRYDTFSIVGSERARGAIFVSPDIAICDDCARELFDPTNRRYLHPFINCTCCGPRLTILDALPYDRERTSMAAFPLCPDCAREYLDPSSRRYDAQPVCCNDCGPEEYLLGRDERGHAAISAARRALAAGGIVAVKGVGGFHLCCDATNERAVSLLRRRKRRPRKPLAVMMGSEEVVHRECTLSAAQEEVLRGHQRPIVLLRRRAGGLLVPSVAPGNPSVGVMLPYAPIQLLLFRYDDDVQVPDCLVMTSGNVSGAPICRDEGDARDELAGLADLILSHDRPIRTRADDSVMDLFEGEPYMIRRSRGYAPLPVVLSQRLARGVEDVCVLAVGGELKNTFCIGRGDLFYPSAHVGDLSDLRTVRALEESVRRMETLLEAHPQAIACDLHPSYNATAIAERLAAAAGVPVVRVQHHFAHIASCLAENDWTGPAVGVAFDGTGLGTDGTIWGGEIMLADYHGFERRASIRPFVQVGGDRSSLEGWRVAVSMLQGLTHDVGRTLELAARLGLCDERSARAQVMMVERRINAVTSTSAGRLFDAASAILGIRRSSTYEGEASCMLEYAARRWAEGRGATFLAAGEAAGDGVPLPLPDVPGLAETGLVEAMPPHAGAAPSLVLGTEGLVRWLVGGRLAGRPVEGLAYGFHAALAHMVATACRAIAREAGVTAVALTGGCYQNRLLLGLTKRALMGAGLSVLTHGLIPPNDGGLALGQAVVAAQAVADGDVDGVALTGIDPGGAAPPSRKGETTCA